VLYDPASGCVQWRGPSLRRDLCNELPLQQTHPWELRVVAAVQVDVRTLRHQAEYLGGL